MSSLSRAVDALGRIATRRQLLRRGYTGRALTSAVLAGSITRVRQGWYASPSASVEQLLAVRVGGRISHLTAARSFGLWAGLDDRVHVAVVRGQSRLREPLLPDTLGVHTDAEVVLHWTEEGRVDRSSAVTWRVSLASCLRGVARSCDRETALACLETAITTFGLTRGRLDEMFAGEPASSRLLAAQARPGSDSGLESIFGQRMRRAGVRVRQQVRFPGIRRVDAVLGRWLIVEIDGREFHDLSATFAKDRRQDAELVALGYVVIRFTYEQVLFDWPFVERTVMAALAARG